MPQYRSSPSTDLFLRLWASLLDGALAAVAVPVASSISTSLFANVVQYFASEAVLGEGLTEDLVLGCIAALGIALLAAVLAWFLGTSVALGISEAVFGATPGKYLLGLRVTKTADNARPGIVRAFARQSAKALSTLPAGIGYIMPLWSADRQMLHDKLSSCRVVRLEDRGAGYIILAIVLSTALLAASYPAIEQTAQRLRVQVQTIRHAYEVLSPAASAAWEIIQQGLNQRELRAP